MKKLWIFASVLTAGLSLSAYAADAPGPVTLTVNVTNISQKVFHAHETMPVTSGPLTLYYPKYIPGEHAPSGPIDDLTGLKFTVDGKAIPWQRDPVDMWTFHLDIPKGATTLEIDLDYLSPTGHGLFSAGVSVTPHLVDLNWNQVALYEAGYPTSKEVYKPTLIIPKGWQYATALDTQSKHGNRIVFKPTTFNTLVDSPVIAGEYFRQIDLAPGARVHRYLDMVADAPWALDIGKQRIAKYRELIKQAQALFQSHHYNDYHFLFVISNYTSHGGVEHHQSSDDRARTGTQIFQDPTAFMLDASLLPHEYTHSWNGKFRRPAELWQPNFETPEQTDMLWVYEGLTVYLGDIMTERSGLWSKQDYLDALAYRTAVMDHQRGREWRPLVDTATAAQLLYGAPAAWSNWRRGTDFYREGTLVWLAVDTKIRQLSHDKRSINDFCRLFFGVDNGRVKTLTYTFDDVVHALNEVQPYDWASMLHRLVDDTSRHAPMEGLARSGWKLVYTDKPSHYEQALENVGPGELSRHGINQMFSIGLFLDKDGNIEDVLWNGPAFKAGVGPGMKIMAVNGRSFTPKVLQEAIAATKVDKAPLELLLESEGVHRRYAIDYHGGLRYPHLVHVGGEPDYLSEILKPLP
ncbi:MAG TPA: M61 family peptidase [Gammaproteobacteria bacterium]|nr:M61 family peptidase [Gammaproteobacteria bacterium]